MSVIAAIGENREIGLNNSLPWELPIERDHFIRTISDHHILMGRKTFEIRIC